jgi:DNA-binding transcriptional ArsR family regulator
MRLNDPNKSGLAEFTELTTHQDMKNWAILAYAQASIALSHSDTPSQIIEKLGIPNATLSFHLKELVNANLLLVERQSRNLIYRPNAEVVQQLSDFLLENCCGGKSCVAISSIKKDQMK